MAGVSSEDNGRKARHGAMAKLTLSKVIEDLEYYGAITSSRKRPHYGYPGYDENQFDAHEEVTFPNGSKAVLFATSSLRSDRIRTAQWRAHNIKQIDPRVELAYVVLPDGHGFDSGTTPRDEIREGRVVSAIDDILTVKEFYDSIVADYVSSLDSGTSHDLQGRNMENLVVGVLNNADNLRRYNGELTSTGYMFDLFRLILEKAGFRPNTIKSVVASRRIPPLPSGGKPKTDVAATITLTDGGSRLITMSLKNTSNKSVSVHEYSADTFADVLDRHNNELRRLLRAFQAAGNKRDMDPNDITSLTNELKPYLDKLNRWVFAGEGAPRVKEVQIAQFVLVRDKNTGAYGMHTIDEYCSVLTANTDGSRWFGTIFSWTYPSKKRGTKIQLKAQIIL